MKLEPATIAHYASHAGFVGPDLHTATAIAWVGSGGLDHYDFSAGSPGVGRYVGLWAIDVCEWPDYAVDTLMAPQSAARAAHELTERVGSFAWSSVWRTGSERPWLDHAARAATEHPFRERETSPIVAVHLARHYAQGRNLTYARRSRR